MAEGKKEVSLLGLFGKKFLEETQGKLAEATGISFFIIDYKGEPVTKGEQEEDFCEKRKEEDIRCSECQITRAFAAAKVQLKHVRIFLLVQMDLFIWRFRLL